MSRCIAPRKPGKKTVRKRGTFDFYSTEVFLDGERSVHGDSLLQYMLDSKVKTWTTNLRGGTGMTRMIPQLCRWQADHPDVEVRASMSAGMLTRLEIGGITIEDYHYEYPLETCEPEILAKEIAAHEDWVWEKLGVVPGSTAGNTARRLLRAYIPSKWWRKNPKQERFLSKFCQGAIVTPGHTSKEWEGGAVCLDMNGMFAAMMRRGGYPDGAGIWTCDDEPGGWYEMVLRCDPAKVSFPFVNLHYVKDGVEHRDMAYGTGIAYLTPELRAEAEAAGYEVVRIVKGLVFERTIDPFSEIIGLLEAIEYDPATSPQDIRWVKSVRTRMNGSLNQSGEYRRVVFSDDLPVGADLFYDDDGMPIWGAYTIAETSEMPHYQPAAYALTVQRGAVELSRVYRALEPHERGTGHTDSSHTTEAAADRLEKTKVIEVGKGYGKWKRERYLAFQGWQLNYWGVTETGELIIKNSAMPEGITRDHWREFREAANAAEETFSFSWNPVTVQSMLGKSEKRWRSMMRPQDVQGSDWDPRTGEFSPLNIGETA